MDHTAEIVKWKSCFSAIVDGRNKMVHVSFQHAPPEYGFVDYFVSLNNDVTKTNVNRTKTNANSVNFTDIKNGQYNIVVYPSDPQQNCIYPSCRQKSGDFRIENGSNDVNLTVCNNTRTHTIINSMPLLEPTETNIFAPTANYLYFLFIPLLFFILAIGIYMWKRYRVKADGTKNTNTSSTTTSVVSTGKVKIFVLYSEDHSFHIEACQSFIHYLNVHCFCDVLNTSPKYTSVPTYEMEKYADFVLVINSQAFYREFCSWKYRETRPAMESRFYPETFEKILENIKQSPSLGSCKYLMCSMDYMDVKYLPPEFSGCKLFKIIDDMTTLVCHLQNLDLRSTNVNDIPRISEHIHSSPDGDSLISAIENADYFEKKHPYWFQEEYKPMRENLPLLHRSDSLDSIV